MTSKPKKSRAPRPRKLNQTSDLNTQLATRCTASDGCLTAEQEYGQRDVALEAASQPPVALAPKTEGEWLTIEQGYEL